MGWGLEKIKIEGLCERLLSESEFSISEEMVNMLMDKRPLACWPRIHGGLHGGLLHFVPFTMKFGFCPARRTRKDDSFRSLQKLDISDFPSISIFFSNNFDTTCTPTHMWLPTVVVLFVCWTFHMLLDLIQGVRVEVIMTRWWHGREDLKACFFFKKSTDV